MSKNLHNRWLSLLIAASLCANVIAGGPVDLVPIAYLDNETPEARVVGESPSAITWSFSDQPQSEAGDLVRFPVFEQENAYDADHTGVKRLRFVKQRCSSRHRLSSHVLR